MSSTTRANSLHWAAFPGVALRQHEDGGDRVNKDKGRVVNARFAVMCATPV